MVKLNLRLTFWNSNIIISENILQYKQRRNKLGCSRYFAQIQFHNWIVTIQSFVRKISLGIFDFRNKKVRVFLTVNGYRFRQGI